MQKGRKYDKQYSYSFYGAVMTGKTFTEHKQTQRISLITIITKTTEWIVYSKDLLNLTVLSRQ